MTESKLLKGITLRGKRGRLVMVCHGVLVFLGDESLSHEVEIP
jgi:hypothetical protein